MTSIDSDSAKGASFGSFSALLRHALGDNLVAPESDTLSDLMTDDVIFEFPFPLPNGPRRIIGKEAFEAYLPKVGDALDIESFTLDRTLLAADGTRAVLEFSCKGSSNVTDARYDQTYVSVLDLRNGRISRYRDYWNPIIALKAVGTGEF